MGRNCFDGYLTDGCAKCADWCDGSDPTRGVGCGTCVPIMWCPHFAKMVAEEENSKEE